MNKEEYYKKSKQEGLTKRCPILNYCTRRAFTIYFFSEYSKFDRNNNMVKALQKGGVLPEDFEEKSIQLQGEQPVFSKGDTHMYFQNMCPEVNLFDTENSIPFAAGTASTDGMWDKLSSGSKSKIEECKHFSECPEFSKFFIDNNGIKIKKSNKSRSTGRKGVSSKLRFEVFQRDKFTCQYCGRKKDDGVKLQLDHKVPVSRGGTDDYLNLITSCEDCNLGKSNKII